MAAGWLFSGSYASNTAYTISYEISFKGVVGAIRKHSESLLLYMSIVKQHRDWNRFRENSNIFWGTETAPGTHKSPLHAKWTIWTVTFSGSNQFKTLLWWSENWNWKRKTLILFGTERLENDFGSNPYIMKPTTALYNLLEFTWQCNSIQHNTICNTTQCNAVQYNNASFTPEFHI